MADTGSSALTYQSSMDAGNYYVNTGGESFFDQASNFLTGGSGYNNRVAREEAANRQYEIDAVNDARNYETWLDSTKYQRAVEDLKAAGLNPWLAAQNGISGSTAHSSASTGGTSKASSSKSLGNSAGMLSALVSVFNTLVKAGSDILSSTISTAGKAAFKK